DGVARVEGDRIEVDVGRRAERPIDDAARREWLGGGGGVVGLDLGATRRGLAAEVEVVRSDLGGRGQTGYPDVVRAVRRESPPGDRRGGGVEAAVLVVGLDDGGSVRSEE